MNNLPFVLLAVLISSLSLASLAATSTIQNQKKSSSSLGTNNPPPPTTKQTKRKLRILNEGKSKFEVYWIDVNTKQPALMSQAPIAPGADFPLDSFVGHTFELREVPGKDGLCKHNTNSDEQGVCRHTYLTVTENDDQLGRVNADFELVFEDNKIKAKQQAGTLLQECQQTAQARLEQAKASQNADETLLAMNELVDCVEGGVAEALQKVNEEIAFQAKVRKELAEKLENYTCVDPLADTTEDLELTYWYDQTADKTKVPRRYPVHVKFDRPSAKIHVIDQFIWADECKAMEETAAKSLHRATVADGKGGSRLSQDRKAMQAGIAVPWHLEHSNDNPIARISRRVYNYANHVLGLNIEHYGQEDLMSIQYFGRGVNDTEPDRYTPHCDGDCAGLPHKPGTRMATMVMYCTVPETGGHTNFRNAGVHVKPQRGSAVFFSYIDPETFLMDTGFTEHSGCPVYEGEKKIVTQWIRYGVDEQNPWDSFNTLGIKKADMMED